MLSSNYNTLLTYVTSERKVLLQDKIYAQYYNINTTRTSSTELT